MQQLFFSIPSLGELPHITYWYIVNLLTLIHYVKEDIPEHLHYIDVSLSGLLLVSPSHGQVTTSTTCDAPYMENNNCANYTFGCNDLNTAMASFPICFSGIQQSPINLDRDGATVSNPGVLTFAKYDTMPSRPLILRVDGYSLRLDFDQTMFRMGTGVTEKPKPKLNKKPTKQDKKKERKKERKRERQEEGVQIDGTTNNLLPSITGGPLRDT